MVCDTCATCDAHSLSSLHVRARVWGRYLLSVSSVASVAAIYASDTSNNRSVEGGRPRAKSPDPPQK